jgi:dTDP-4-amino-4,6-dideoxygalactose transaminase
MLVEAGLQHDVTELIMSMQSYRVPYNRPFVSGEEKDFISQAISSGSLAGPGPFSRRCEEWVSERTGVASSFFVPSCTHGLEMAALVASLKTGDEVIVPAYTYVSTANAFAVRGAKPVLVDVRLDTCNINEQCIEQAITPRTRAIVPVHYAGVACDMARILDIASEHNLLVIEDAAQGFLASWKGQALGAIGDFGAYSFHATKNITSGGEGGMLLARRREHVDPGRVVRDKGTDREGFLNGTTSSYSWQGMGSSYVVSELQAAALWAQLGVADVVTQRRLELWQLYQDQLSSLCEGYGIAMPCVPEGCTHNGHIFYLRLPSRRSRDHVISYMRDAGIQAQSHYQPLHTSPGASRLARVSGECANASEVAETIVRLPLFNDLSEDEAGIVLEAFRAAVQAFFGGRGNFGNSLAKEGG